MALSYEEMEKARLDLLSDLEILDTVQEEIYDDLTTLAATICETPISFMALADKNRHFFKSTNGFEMKEIPTEIAFCTHVIQKNETLIIPDAKEDQTFKNYPAVTSMNIRFYTGIPLQITGIPVGTLCVMDNSTNRLCDEQLSSLKILGKQIVSQLNLRLKHKELCRLREREKHLIAIVSHELRTPLTSVYGTLTLLRSDKIEFSDEKKGKLLDSCYRNTAVLKELVNDLLESASLDSDRILLEKKVGNLNEVIQNTLNKTSTFLMKCNVEAEVVLDNTIEDIEFDELRMTQIITNIVSNAAKFSKPGDKIYISTFAYDNQVCFKIKDNGPGIPVDKQNNIFEKFTKFTQPHQNLPGTGLGLYVTKLLVEAHEGHITLESKVGVGTSFIVSFPQIESSKSNIQELSQRAK